MTYHALCRNRLRCRMPHSSLVDPKTRGCCEHARQSAHQVHQCSAHLVEQDSAFPHGSLGLSRLLLMLHCTFGSPAPGHSVQDDAGACSDTMAVPVRSREHVAAMKWLAWLLKRRRRDPELVSQMGYMQLIIGDTAAAAVSFQQVLLLLSMTTVI